jgi:hypothetical protein
MRRFFFVPGHFDKNRAGVFKSQIQAQEKVQAIPGGFSLWVFSCTNSLQPGFGLWMLSLAAGQLSVQ